MDTNTDPEYAAYLAALRANEDMPLPASMFGGWLLAKKVAMPAEKLLQIIACAYRMALHHGTEVWLDVLSNPEGATQEQIDVLLPYQPVPLAEFNAKFLASQAPLDAECAKVLLQKADAARAEGFVGGPTVKESLTVAPISDESTWRPIETAPKGKEVLVWRKDSGPFVAQLATPDAVISEMDLRNMIFPDDFEEWFSGAYGWQEGDERPTHWMPLPDDPERALLAEVSAMSDPTTLGRAYLSDLPVYHEMKRDVDRYALLCALIKSRDYAIAETPPGAYNYILDKSTLDAKLDALLERPSRLPQTRSRP